MQQQDIEKFHEQLCRLRDELKSAAATDDQRQTVELDQSRMGRLSRMDAMQAQQVALEQKRRNQLKLNAVEGALRRIENDLFGYCFICGEPISMQRLEFDPTLTRCLGCVDHDD